MSRMELVRACNIDGVEVRRQHHLRHILVGGRTEILSELPPCRLARIAGGGEMHAPICEECRQHQ
ncbi:hypothetical protein D9M68_492620 [compost metagenome]